MKWKRRITRREIAKKIEGWKALMGIINFENVIAVSWEVEELLRPIKNIP